MQFGKFHGLTLLGLGGLLVLLQTFMIFQGLGRSASQPRPTDQSLQAESRATYRSLTPVEYVPGVAGVALLGLGVWLVARRQKEILDHFPEDEAEKFQEVARSRR